MGNKLSEEKLLFIGQIPIDIAQTIKYGTMEFAGVKFKTKATSGEQYLKHIKHGLLHQLLFSYPNLLRVVICEEKYIKSDIS